MGFYYDFARPGGSTTNASAATASTHAWAKTGATQETLYIMGLYAAARGGTAGGACLRADFNTGTTASGGTVLAANKKNANSPAALSTWQHDSAGITPGTTLVQRVTVGFAQTGGMGGYVPPVGAGALQMLAGATNPVDVELVSIANGGSVLFEWTVDFCEGSPT